MPAENTKHDARRGIMATMDDPSPPPVHEWAANMIPGGYDEVTERICTRTASAANKMDREADTCMPTQNEGQGRQRRRRRRRRPQRHDGLQHAAVSGAMAPRQLMCVERLTVILNVNQYQDIGWILSHLLSLSVSFPSASTYVVLFVNCANTVCPFQPIIARLAATDGPTVKVLLSSPHILAYGGGGMSTHQWRQLSGPSVHMRLTDAIISPVLNLCA